ncbi:MAG: lamin tail domain-containing protein [Tidjanibacter sp.]|nr:lamin tail domain-containing protein [Tidjanibacter sp.]
MKKLFVFAALAALALTSCSGDIELGKDDEKVNPLVLNELDGQSKFIELYNNTSAAIDLAGYTLVKYDSTKEGGKSTTWTAAAGMTIASKGFVVLESSDLADPEEKGDPNYEYESENHVFKGGLSPKKNVKIELVNPEGEVVDTFIRGEEGAGWNQTKLNENEECSFSRVPNGSGDFAYAAPTKGAENGEKVAAID